MPNREADKERRKKTKRHGVNALGHGRVAGKIDGAELVAVAPEQTQMELVEETTEAVEVVEKPVAVEEVPLEDAEEVPEVAASETTDTPDSLTEEYNPDDEDEDPSEGTYGYGWGYNDAFDKPEDEDVVAKDAVDEDERYAAGLDKESKSK